MSCSYKRSHALTIRLINAGHATSGVHPVFLLVGTGILRRPVLGCGRIYKLGVRL
jgi:hypothetical protein